MPRVTAGARDTGIATLTRSVTGDLGLRDDGAQQLALPGGHGDPGTDAALPPDPAQPPSGPPVPP
ncbi:hypothetical protein [Amycolatopsis minnesotensis]|uniref:hypothetical protein n=1 Tax=Amycolatopsis minnesotensis TaxID=337894 RepID=UPI0031D8748C